MSDEIEIKIAQLIRSKQKEISPTIIKGLQQARGKALLAKITADNTRKQSRKKLKRQIKALMILGICFVLVSSTKRGQVLLPSRPERAAFF